MTEIATQESAAPMKWTEDEMTAAWDAVLDGKELPFTSDPGATSRAIIERIMQSSSFDEVVKPQSLISWSADMMGLPVIIKRFHLNKAQFRDSPDSPSVYAVVDVQRLDDGEVVTCSIGSRNVLGQLLRFAESGWLDNPEYAVKLSSTEFRTDEGEKRQAFWLVKPDAKTSDTE